MNNKRRNIYIIQKEFSNILKTILKEKEFIKEFLNYTLKINLKYIEISCIEKYESISEYDFSLLKINGILNDNNKIEIYLRMIKGGKIKESVYCFWSLLYKDYMKSNKNFKVNIIEKEINFWKNTITLKVEEDLSYKQFGQVELNFIKLDNIIKKEFIKEKIDIWKDFLNKNNILLVGIKNNIDF